MANQYNLKNIRTLLVKGFSESELRTFCFEEPDFEDVYNQLSQGTGKDEVVHLLLDHARRKSLIENLLTWAKEHNPATYEKYQPYYDITISLPTTGSVHKKSETDNENLQAGLKILAERGVAEEFLRGLPEPPENTNSIQLETSTYSTAGDIYGKSRITEIEYNPFGNDIDDDRLSEWLGQFRDDELPLIWPLLKNFKYYDSRKVSFLAESLYRKLTEEHKIQVEKTCFVPVGYVAKSGDIVAYLFKRVNELPETAFYRSSDLKASLLDERPLVVFLDDFIGSGHDGLRLGNEVVRTLKEKIPKAHFILGALAGYEVGIERIKAEGLMDVCVVEQLGRETQPFAHDSQIYPDEETRKVAESVIRKYSNVIKPRSPHGFGNIQGLVAFFYGTPNNTLPLFWLKSDRWNPLLPYGESLRDPGRLIGLPGMSETSARRNNSDDSYEGFSGSVFFNFKRTIGNDSDYSFETTHRLVEMFETLQPIEVAVRAFRHVGMEERTIHSIAYAIPALRVMKHQGRPIRTALFFPSQSELKDLENNLYLRLNSDSNLSNLEQAETIYRFVDGLEGAIVVSANGGIKGGILYPDDVCLQDAFVPRRYQRAAAASYKGNGLIFLFLGNDNIVLFDRGYRVMSYLSSKWHIQGMLQTTLLAAEHGLANGIIEKVMSIAIELVDIGHGDLFTLGDVEGVKRYINSKIKYSWSWQNLNVTDSNPSPILYAAREDGATIVDETGTLIHNMVMLAPPPDDEAVEEVGMRARHNTASKVSAVTGALTVAVSREGTITMYSKGRRVFRVMG